jgi:hypothetical protein
MRLRLLATLTILFALASPASQTATPVVLLEQWKAEANPGAAPFDAARGRRLFETKMTDWSCSSCHTADPRRPGRHVVTGKPIEPLAPSANPVRFTDDAKVAKWLRRNCRDVLARECSAQEKGDLLTWLMSLN